MIPDYGPLHYESLKQNQPDVVKGLERSGERFRYLRGFAQRCAAVHERCVAGLAQNHPFSEKEFGTIEQWERWLDQVARELVMDEVLVPDAETEEARRNGYLD